MLSRHTHRRSRARKSQKHSEIMPMPVWMPMASQQVVAIIISSVTAVQDTSSQRHLRAKIILRNTAKTMSAVRLSMKINTSSEAVNRQMTEQMDTIVRASFDLQKICLEKFSKYFTKSLVFFWKIQKKYISCHCSSFYFFILL